MSESIEQRLARLEAIEAIKQLKHKYLFNCDQKRPALVRECFVDGPANIDFGRVGCFDNADALVAVFEQLACAEHIVEMHHAQNPQIELHSDTKASAVWGLYYYMIDTRQQITTQLAGFYEDEYRCGEDGEWKISACHYTVTSSQILAMSDAMDGMVQRIFAGSQAPSELDDPSKQQA